MTRKRPAPKDPSRPREDTRPASQIRAAIPQAAPGKPRDRTKGKALSKPPARAPQIDRMLDPQQPWAQTPEPRGETSEGRTRYESRGDRDHRQPRRGRPERRDEIPKTSPDIALIWGFHSVREALRAGRRKLVRLHATEAAAEKLAPEIAASGVTVETTSGEDIERRLPRDSVHQGVLLEARHLPVIDIEDLPDDGFVLVLDQVTDPHNVGAILRTAAAFGVDAIVTTERHSPALTGVLAKAASGGLEHVPITSVVNLARALEAMERRGYTRVGLDSDATISLAEAPVQRPLALVLGAEGKGLRRLTRENCDVLARIDLPGAVRSLNVSNACAVALTLLLPKVARGA